jgi:hypothetical protein
MCFYSNILNPALKGNYLESTYSENFDMFERNIHCDVSANA